MESGETYTFVQADVTITFIPSAFPTFPTVLTKIGPGITQNTDNNCADALTCDAPMYFLSDEYLGECSNPHYEETEGQDNFGLGDYEPMFFRPFPEWVKCGEFSVQLRFTDEDHQGDILYFCHVRKREVYLSCR